MNKRLTRRKKETAFHEAGHALAYILIDRKFKYVTIKPDAESLGRVMPYFRSKKIAEWVSSRNFYDPLDFGNHFKQDFISLAGYAAAKILTGRYTNNIYHNRGDYDEWINRSLISLPDKLNLSFQGFMRQYVIEVLNHRNNWLRIEAIAEALLERETLNYDQVWKVISLKMEIALKNELSKKPTKEKKSQKN